MTTQAIARPPDLDREIQDANLGLIAAAGRLLDEAERVKRYRDKLLAAINRKQDGEATDAS